MQSMMGFIKEHIHKMEDTFFSLVRKKIEPHEKLMSYYRCALMAIETKFNILNEEFSFEHERNPIETIKTRIKTPESLRKKMRERDIPFNMDSVEKNINDIAGIRVICPFIDDIFMLAGCLVNQDDITLLEKKDYITHPKENGYRGLHLIIAIPIYLHNEKKLVKVEIQLRTIAMDFWANLEHRLRYKKDLSGERAREISAELTECAETSALLDLKMKKIRDSIEKPSLLKAGPA